MSPGPHVAFQRRPSTRDAGARAQAGSSTNQALAARGGTLASDPHAALCPGPEPPLELSAAEHTGRAWCNLRRWHRFPWAAAAPGPGREGRCGKNRAPGEHTPSLLRPVAKSPLGQYKESPALPAPSTRAHPAMHARGQQAGREAVIGAWWDTVQPGCQEAACGGTVPQPSSPGWVCGCCVLGRRRWEELCPGLSPRERPAVSLPPRSPWAIGERQGLVPGVF